MSGRAAAVVLAVAVALQAALAIDALRGNSATFDEGAHLPAGYTHLVLGDHRLNPEQPPLVKLLAAAPLVALRPVVHTDDRSWREARQWEFGRRFLYRWNDGERLLFFGRLPIVALASLLVAGVFAEARRRFGTSTAAAAALLAALSPDVLAHGGLVTTDLGFALFFFLSVVSFARLLERPRWPWLLASGLACGAAFATKFSAPILVLVLVALAVLDGGGARLRRRTLLLLATGAIAFAVLWASYGFHHDLSPDAGVRAELAASTDPPASAPLRLVLAAGDAGVLPEAWARGLVFVLTHSEARSTFLLGSLSDRGFPLYFLFTFLLKTPLPLLFLLPVALLRAPRLERRTAVFLWLPVAVYVALTFTRGLQIGHRHLLPIYPFLILAAAEAAVRLSAWRRPAGPLLAALLAAWYAGGTLLNHPYHLSYFNELAGGPPNGWRVLVDSNLDWGQDLKRLAEWVRANHVTRLKLSYFGSADPAYYGLDAEMLPGYTSPHAARVTREIVPGDIVAVSATNLQGVYLDAGDRPLMARLRSLEPIARVGWSIRVYRADFVWPEGGEP